MNVMADSLSRDTPIATEWQLPKDLFQRILSWHGPLEIDMMAAPLNSQLPKFIAPFFHPNAEGTDALTMNWNR